MEHSRREFVAAGASGLGVAWLAASLPAIGKAASLAAESRERGVFVVLGSDEAEEFEAIASTIIPSGDDGPGAREAGVIHFIDRAFETFQAGALPFARDGLEDVQARVERRHPGQGPFSRLDEEARVAVLEEVEADADAAGFLSLMQFLTVAGMFSLPSYGGNRDRAGWELLGFEDRFVWQPPFGFYDAETRDG